MAKGWPTPSGKRQTSKVPLDAWVDASIDFVLAADAAAAADARCRQTLTDDSENLFDINFLSSN